MCCGNPDRADRRPTTQLVVADCAGTGAKNSRLRPLLKLFEPIRDLQTRVIGHD